MYYTYVYSELCVPIQKSLNSSFIYEKSLFFMRKINVNSKCVTLSLTSYHYLLWVIDFPFYISKMEHADYKQPLNYLFTIKMGTNLKFCSNVTRKNFLCESLLCANRCFLVTLSNKKNVNGIRTCIQYFCKLIQIISKVSKYFGFHLHYISPPFVLTLLCHLVYQIVGKKQSYKVIVISCENDINRDYRGAPHFESMS